MDSANYIPTQAAGPSATPNSSYFDSMVYARVPRNQAPLTAKQKGKAPICEHEDWQEQLSLERYGQSGLFVLGHGLQTEGGLADRSGDNELGGPSPYHDQYSPQYEDNGDASMYSPEPSENRQLPPRRRSKSSGIYNPGGKRVNPIN